MAVHLHAGGRSVTIIPSKAPKQAPSAPKASDAYMELTERVLRALGDFLKMEAAVTGDEESGHPFHGNQWTGGLGAKPQSTMSKVPKHALHELLSSGHPFSKAELMEILGPLGLKEKTLGTFLVMLKNPKYAGSKGALEISKNADGTYQVMVAPGLTGKPSGNPDTVTLAEVLGQKQVQPDIPEHFSELKPGQGEALFFPPAAKKPDLIAPEKIEVPTELLDKAAADAKYQKKLMTAATNLALQLPAKKVDTLQKAILEFKQEKADAMAWWASAVHGKVVTPIKQDTVYPADEILADDIADGPGGLALQQMEYLKKALANWKQNTANGKAGKAVFSLKTLAALAKQATPTNVAPLQSAMSGWATDLADKEVAKPKAYNALVPQGFKTISPTDITKAQGFKSNMLAFKKDLETASAGAVSNKLSVETKLETRLADKPHYQALSKAWAAKGKSTSLTRHLVSVWAGSSGDGSDSACAMQVAIKDAFSMPDEHIETKQLHAYEKAGSEEAMMQAGLKATLGLETSTGPAEVKAFKAALVDFVHAQYDETQAMLKAQGRSHIYVARGMKIQSDGSTAALSNKDPVGLKLQPASSFSASYKTASSFAGHGTVFLAKVPREQVLSTYLTGFGCSNEHEVVVLSHKATRSYMVPKSTGITSLTEAVAKLKAYFQVNPA